MRYIRFHSQGRILYGIVEGDQAFAISASPFEKWRTTGDAFPLSKVRLLAPVLPSKIVCVGLNYADHAAETGEPLPDEPCIFLKPSTATIGPADPIRYPAMASRVDHEAELAFVIKKTARNVSPDDWSDYLLGYTCLNDVTARDLQAKDGQWTRAKGFDTFAPLGPFITDDVSPDDLRITARVNGDVKQDSSTKNLIFPPSFLLPFVSRIMTLLPGDVIATGTPSGISPVVPGDVVEVEIEGIGILQNTVAPPEN